MIEKHQTTYSAIITVIDYYVKTYEPRIALVEHFGSSNACVNDDSAVFGGVLSCWRDWRYILLALAGFVSTSFQ